MFVEYARHPERRSYRGACSPVFAAFAALGQLGTLDIWQRLKSYISIYLSICLYVRVKHRRPVNTNYSISVSQSFLLLPLYPSPHKYVIQCNPSPNLFCQADPWAVSGSVICLVPRVGESTTDTRHWIGKEMRFACG